MALPDIKCRGCGTELEASTISCPICGRPRTRGEMLRDLQGTRDAQASARRRPKVLIVLALLGLTAYQSRQQWLPLLKQRLTGKTAAPPAGNAAPDAARDGGLPPAAAPTPPANGSAPPQMPVADPVPVNPLANETAPSAPAPDPGDPDALVPQGFAEIFGSVYDLFDLKPVPAAFLEFENLDTGDKTTTRTGPKGRYRLALSASQKGFRVKIRKKGYGGEYLEEGTPSLKTWSLARREQAAYEAAQGATLHVPVTVEGDTRRARYDVILIPKE